jgi:REP element-mobilizing transposase RayT
MPDRTTPRKDIRLDERVYSQPGIVALLTSCTSGKSPLFGNAIAAQTVTEEIRRLHGDCWRMLGFCVMPDHVHLLVLNVERSLVDLMKLLKGRTSSRLRGLVNGPVWQRSFHDHILRRNEDINRTLLYLLENPVRAGLAARWTEYEWCGSLVWPDVEPGFFETNPADVLWSEVFTSDVRPD